jgi:maltose-binding protein MalE
VSGSVVKKIVALGLLAALAACSSTDTSGLFTSVSKKKESDTAGNDPNIVVMQGACPQVYLREGTAVYREYVRGVKKDVQGLADPNKLVIQATLDATLYSELTKFQVTVPAGQGSTQFTFTKDNVVLANIGTMTRLYAGIDEGPYNTK